ncbi:MAG: ABC transporter ATP-binding protein [Lentisphaerae bacterium]|nr:ABC transporter ATP-binding protein [Lentisphaerota bacterium]MCP4103731.1 ABC transporter ATP-binding protein [Lentisphaerota bacterium]
MPEIMNAQNLKFGYSRENTVLEDFSFKVKNSEFVGLIGPNGSGKTTILKLLSGYLSPKAGDIFLGKQKINLLSSRQRARILGVVPQVISTTMPFTVKQVVEMGRTARISPFLPLRGHDHEAVCSAMNEMDVFEIKNSLFSQLSGGERQRTIIAAALAQEPEMLLLDEPTSSLDLGHKLQLMGLLKGLQARGMTVMAVSHDIELMAKYCDRLVLLKNGKVLASGAPPEIITPELIKEAYGCEVNVIVGINGEPLISAEIKAAEIKY